MHPQMVQAHPAEQQYSQPQMTSMQRIIQMVSQKFYQQGYEQLAMQYGGQIPPKNMMQYKRSCSMRAEQYVQQMRAQQAQVGRDEDTLNDGDEERGDDN